MHDDSSMVGGSVRSGDMAGAANDAELAIAWACDEVTLDQLTGAISTKQELSKASTCSWIAFSLRDAINQGLLVKAKKGVD